MRYRQKSQAHVLSGSNFLRLDLLDNTYLTPGTNPGFNESASTMWDDPTGSRKQAKACVHASMSLDANAQEDYDSGNASRYPYPRYQYQNYCVAGYLALPSPPETIGAAQEWIAVSSDTFDDIGDCVFKAYNQFVNGVRALDSSVSICEADETPHLFALWKRRLGAPANIVNGFLNYSFGWKPLISDLRAIAKELRSFPQTVRRRLKKIGDKDTVQHYSFNPGRVDDLNGIIAEGEHGDKPWQKYRYDFNTVNKSRTVIVTIRANVKPKLSGHAQDIANKLGALGLIPSLATLWKVTRLSFVVDWFFNIGGAIENLQGSLTHNISNVRICVTDRRSRIVDYRGPNTGGYNSQLIARVYQETFERKVSQVPLIPQLHVPRRPMQYVLLGLLALTNTKNGREGLAWVDGFDKLSPKAIRKIELTIQRLRTYERAKLRRLGNWLGL